MKERIFIDITDENKFEIGRIVKDENYIEIRSTDTHEIDNAIKEIVRFREKYLLSQKEKEEVEKNKAFEDLLEIFIKNSTDEEKVKNIHLFHEWKINQPYKINDYRKHHEKLFRCKKEHKSDYELIPINSPDYWEEIGKKKDHPIYDHETTYKPNDIVLFNGKAYRSLIKQQGQSPFSSPSTWMIE